MIFSVITINNFFKDRSEMIILKCIGSVQAGYSRKARLNRLLPKGHRIRGYEE